MRKALEQIFYLANVALNGTERGYYETNRADISRIADEALRRLSSTKQVEHKDGNIHNNSVANIRIVNKPITKDIYIMCSHCAQRLGQGASIPAILCPNCIAYNDKIAKAIMKNIADGFDERGHFLQKFARMFNSATEPNKECLLPAAHKLIALYDIEKSQREKGVLNEAQYM